MKILWQYGITNHIRKLLHLYQTIRWYKCASLRMWFVIPYYHKIFHFCCFRAMAYIRLWNWVQFCLFSTSLWGGATPSAPTPSMAFGCAWAQRPVAGTHTFAWFVQLWRCPWWLNVRAVCLLCVLQEMKLLTASVLCCSAHPCLLVVSSALSWTMLFQVWWSSVIS